VLETYRVPQEQLELFQSVLDMYVGTHKFHNYTSQVNACDPMTPRVHPTRSSFASTDFVLSKHHKKSYNDSSASRYIVSFQSFPPYEVDGVEWMRVQVRGQSFVLHQIRKMIGTVQWVALCNMSGCPAFQRGMH
jgi:tRNA U38,U39,U40 pseudouridine synthase TruA